MLRQIPSIWIYCSRKFFLNHETKKKFIFSVFRNLKILEISTRYCSIYDKAFANCRRLESLSFGPLFDDLTPSSLNAIRASLKTNNGLKVLRIFGSVFEDDFSSEIGFKLREFSIDDLEIENQHQNVNLFLKTQVASLEVLTIECESFDVEYMTTVLSMPRLKKFTLKCQYLKIPANVANILPQNHSVTHLDLTTSWPKPEEIENILKAFPRIEFLEILAMTDETAVLIAKSCKFLKKLSTMIFTTANDFAFFPNLVKFSCQAPSGKFQKSLVSFLEKQSDSLEVLSIMNICNADHLKIILSMPRLRKLCFAAAIADFSDLAVESLPKSLSVTKLKLLAGNMVDKALLGAFPKVQSLEILGINNELADLISKTCKSLKHLHVERFLATKVSNEAFFLNLATFTCEDVDGRSSAYQLYQKLCTHPKPAMKFWNQML